MKKHPTRPAPPAYLRARLADRGGFVILWAIFGFVVMVSLATLVMRVAGSERLAANAAVESTRSFYAAETGLRKTLAELEDSVFQALQPGDSLVGDGLIPGGGADSLGWMPLDSLTSYHTVLHRVDEGDADGQWLYQLTVKGRGEGYYGGESVLSLSLTPPTAWGNQAIMFAKELNIGASPSVLGACGGIYAGGDITNLGNMTIEQGVATSGVVTGNGDFEDPDGNPVTPEEGVALEEVPLLDPLDYCGEADFILRGGWNVDAATMDSVYLVNEDGEPVGGWTYKSGTEPEYIGAQGVANGTYCVYGNMDSSGSFGQAAPGGELTISILATGSIDLSGRPFMLPDHSEGWLLMAGGDLKVGGKAEIGYVNVEGRLYGGSQCQFGGTPIIHGQILCSDEPDPPGAHNLLNSSKIMGTIDITYDCGSSAAYDAALIPLAERAWAQRF